MDLQFKRVEASAKDDVREALQGKKALRLPVMLLKELRSLPVSARMSC